MLHFVHFYFNLKDELCDMRWWVMFLYPVSRTLLRCDWISSNWMSKVYQSFSPSKRLWHDIANVHPHLSSHHFLVSGVGYNKHALIHVWIGWRSSLSTHFLLQREQQISVYGHVNNITVHPLTTSLHNMAKVWQNEACWQHYPKLSSGESLSRE